MAMRNNWLAAMCAGVMTLSVAPISDAQPKEKKEKRKEKKEERKEKREDRKEKREERKEERKDKLEELRDKRKEKKEKFDELKKKEADGSLTDEEKEELESMKAVHSRKKAKYDKLKERHQERRKNHTERRRKARKAALKKWGKAHLAKAPVKKEMGKHALRMARLNRLRNVAEAEENDDAVARIDKLIALENARHDKRMDGLKE